jgi:hypothetical protein
VNQRDLIAFDAARVWMEGGRASAAIAVALIDGSKPPLLFEKLPLVLNLLYQDAFSSSPDIG